MKKNIAIAVLSLIIICGAIVIGTSSMGNTAQEIISNAITATMQLKNFEVVATTHTEQQNKQNGAITSITQKVDLIYFSSPQKYKIESNTTFSGGTEESSMDFLRYLIAEGGENIMYNYSFERNEWDISRFPSNMQANLSIGRENSIKEDIDFYLRSVDNFEKNGEEKIKEYNTVKLAGKITGSQIGETVRCFVTIDSEVIGKATEEIDGIDITVWIDKKTYHVVKYTVDFAEIYKLLYEKIFSQAKDVNPDALEIITEKYISETVVFNFNKATDFEIPEDALNAQEYTHNFPEN